MPRLTTNQWNANILFHFHTNNTARRHVLLCLIAFCSSFVRVVSFRIKCAAVPSFTLSTVAGVSTWAVGNKGTRRDDDWRRGRCSFLTISSGTHTTLHHHLGLQFTPLSPFWLWQWWWLARKNLLYLRLLPVRRWEGGARKLALNC